MHPDTRSWTELSFGDDESSDPSSPWQSALQVLIAGAGLRFSGRIDRVDLRADAVTISDYKSGKVPRNPGSIVIARGNELQRVLYAMAVRQLLPDVRSVASRLLYLAEETAPCALEGEALDNAIAEVTQFVALACEMVRNGATVRGEDAHEKSHDDLRLALPADRDAYLRRKQRTFAEANKALLSLWSRP
jgi:ATP-dependent helicase/DNAse subunit B